MHINVKPLDRNQAYTTPKDAIEHLFIYGCYHAKWSGVQFGRDMNAIRKMSAAIKNKDVTAFIAQPRKGYWRIEVAA